MRIKQSTRLCPPTPSIHYCETIFVRTKGFVYLARINTAHRRRFLKSLSLLPNVLVTRCILRGLISQSGDECHWSRIVWKFFLVTFSSKILVVNLLSLSRWLPDEFHFSFSHRYNDVFSSSDYLQNGVVYFLAVQLTWLTELENPFYAFHLTKLINVKHSRP